MFHKIGVIINPASGVEFPVLFHINQALKHAEIEAEYHITQQANDAYSMAQAAVERGVGAIAVYGGDGTIMEVAQALSRTKIPLIILPGGSANVMAKELGIPTTLQEAVSIFSKDKHQLVDIDMGVCNKIPFMLRVTAGIWEKVVTQAKRDQKNKIGQLAYTIPIIDQLSTLEQQRYRLHFNSTTLEVSGLGLMITNAGNTGIANISYIPDISVTDGLLDAVLWQATDIPSVISAVAATINPSHQTPAISHWQSTTFEVELLDSPDVILDDKVMSFDRLQIKVYPQALRIAL